MQTVCQPVGRTSKSAGSVRVRTDLQALKPVDLFNILPMPGNLDPGPLALAADYCTWINVIDPVAQQPRAVTPGGSVAGICARTDADIGVWKAPGTVAVTSAHL